MKHPFRPKGCDDQGRYPEAAEAATDIGVDEPPRQYDSMIEDIAIAIVVIGAICVVAYRLIWG